MAKRKIAVEADVTEAGYTVDTFNVIRRNYFGDPGQNCGVGLTREAAEKYAAERRSEGEQCAYEVVPV